MWATAYLEREPLILSRHRRESEPEFSVVRPISAAFLTNLFCLFRRLLDCNCFEVTNKIIANFPLPNIEALKTPTWLALAGQFTLICALFHIASCTDGAAVALIPRHFGHEYGQTAKTC